MIPMRHVVRATAAIPLLILAVTFPAGCEVVDNMIPGNKESEEPDATLQAAVTLEDPDFGGTFIVLVTVSKSSWAEGVGKLRTQKWDEAITFFHDALESERRENRQAEAYFAIGVAHEAQKEYSQAASAYESALELANVSDYQDGVNRARAALGQ